MAFSNLFVCNWCWLEGIVVYVMQFHRSFWGAVLALRSFISVLFSLASFGFITLHHCLQWIYPSVAYICIFYSGCFFFWLFLVICLVYSSCFSVALPYRFLPQNSLSSPSTAVYFTALAACFLLFLFWPNSSPLKLNF